MEVLGAVAIPVFLVLSTIIGSPVTLSGAQVANLARFRKFYQAPFIDRAGYFPRKSIGEIDQTNRLILSHSPAAGSCSRC